MRKVVLLLSALVSVILLNGCQSCSICCPKVLPDLRGEWSVFSYSHHHAEHGYMSNPEPKAKWTIVDQQENHFHGERVYTRSKIDGAEIKEGFSGVISDDGTRVYIVDHVDDIVIGDIVSGDEMVLYILGKTYRDKEPRAGCVILKKAK